MDIEKHNKDLNFSDSQTPWLDDNGDGNGSASPLNDTNGDGSLATSRRIGTQGNAHSSNICIPAIRLEGVRL